jgi:hypothetical protein
MLLLLESSSVNKKLNVLGWLLQVALIAILLFDVVTKVIGAEKESYIFDLIGLGSLGRFLAAFFQVLAFAALMVPRFYREGAVLSVLVMAVGLFFHLTELGVVVLGDGGRRFYSILIGLVFAILLFFIRTHLLEIMVRKGKL